MTGSTVITQHLDRFAVQPASTTATMQSVGALRHDTSDFAAHSPASKPATYDRNFTLRYVTSTLTLLHTVLQPKLRLRSLTTSNTCSSSSSRGQVASKQQEPDTGILSLVATASPCARQSALCPLLCSALLYGGCCCPKAPTQKVEVQHLATFKSRTLRDDLSS